jgi:ABC-2 type transport system ATP-binding protein
VGPGLIELAPASTPGLSQARPEGTAPGPVLLSVSQLTKAYGSRTAVRDVSFELAAGVCGVLGPNGAGKTTLLRCLAGLAAWDSGTVHVDGIDLVRRTDDARRRTGFMPERVAFPSEMRVDEYLRFVGAVKGVPRRDRAATVAQILAKTGLEAARSRIIANLSKGYRQRVGLAQALLGDAPVVILDEPSAGLDPLTVMELRETLRDCGRDRALLVSTPLLAEARLLCDRVIVMNHGDVVYDGPTTEMLGPTPGKRQLRLLVAGVSDSAPVIDTAGARLLGSEGRDGQHRLVVEADDDRVVGQLVAELVAGEWAVLRVEPTTDALEEAFRRAVVDRS